MDNNINRRTDALLMEILEERKTVTGFLDAIFGFLKRKTDFYHIQKDAAEKIGFPKGIREELLYTAMQRYNPEVSANKLTTESDATNAEDYVPPAQEETEVSTAEYPSESMRTMCPPHSHVAGKQQTENKKNFEFAFADYKNGAQFEQYCWSQTKRDIEIHVRLPDEICNAKSIKVDLTSEKLVVRNKMQPQTIIFEGTLSSKCKYNELVWTITENQLTINFDKLQELWWERLFTDENPIDVQTLDSTVDIHELPDESRAAIQKLKTQQLEQDAKMERLNRENHNSALTVEKLRQAWDAEGSPFKGQPFDPSVLRF